MQKAAHTSKTKPLIVALDVDSVKKGIEIVNLLGNLCQTYKVGSYLFTQAGAKIVALLQQKGKQIFLDLKYHDIPNTVAHACQQAVKIGANLLTIHLTGGSEMIKKATESVKEANAKYNANCQVLGVSLLSSIDEAMLQKELQVKIALPQYFLTQATLGAQNGIDGFIASPHEISLLKEQFPSHLIVTPGITLPGITSEKSTSEKSAVAGGSDQKRTASPQRALSLGADYIVMGRSILTSPNPIATIQSIFV